ncbi:MAG: hypothetical protein MI920_08965 [Kiloniellales bacterium]|nr:hypothetical protein [Kiloniellales bacterium]
MSKTDATDLRDSPNPYVPPAAVRAQLSRILASKEFERSETLGRFLSFVVEEALAGRGSSLKAYIIGVEVYGRDESFDPQADSIVRVEGSRLRRKLTHYNLTEGCDDPVVIEIPKGGYAPAFRWAESDTSAAEPDAAGPVSAKTRPWRGRRMVLGLSAAALAGLILAGLVVTQFLDPFTQPEPAPVASAETLRPSISVLPIKVLNYDPAQSLFADGLTEEISISLTRFRDLKVVGRHIAYRYRDPEQDLRQASRELNAQYLLAGSVRREADRVRVVVHLVDGATGVQLWSETYDRAIEAIEIIKLQDDIGQRVAAALAQFSGVIPHRQMMAVRRKASTSLDAYECVLKMYDHWRKFDLEGYKEARSCLQNAVKSDPHYADAWAALAHLHNQDLLYGLNPGSETRHRALAAAQRAVELGPFNGRAFLSLAGTHFARGELDEMKTAIGRALVLNPNDPDGLAVAGFFETYIGNQDVGMSLMRRAIELNPNFPWWYNAPFIVDRFLARDFEAALAYAKAYAKPGHLMAQVYLAMIYGEMGRGKEAEAAVSTLMRIDPGFPAKARAKLSRWNLPRATEDRMVAALVKAGVSFSRDP